jgi:hypothetical protein
MLEMEDALRRNDGLPPKDETEVVPARDVGRERERGGFPLASLVYAYSALSVAVGEVGAAQGLSFGADEYGVFNQTIDRHVADAVDGFAQEERTKFVREHDERLAFVAHELRNALSSASTAFTLMSQGSVGINGATGDILRRSHRRMERLIEQVLVSARAGAAKIALVPLSLAPLVSELVSGAVRERGIELAVDVDDSLKVIAEEDLLTSALSNLLQNAVKYSRDGATVTVRARPISTDGAGDSVVVEVEDECGGLPDGVEQELFQPFTRHRRDRRGVGLGLAITRDVVQVLRGQITVQNLPGTGCIFAVTLARAPVAVEARR